MAVSSPGRKMQLTRLTATWPPKRMVRSRVSSVWVIRASSESLSSGLTGVAVHSDVMRGLDPRIHPLPELHLFGRGWIAGSSPAMTDPSPLVLDRDVHVLDLQFAHRLQHGPFNLRIDLDLEVVHALQRLMVLLPEDHLALRRIELQAFHGADQLFGVGGFGLGDGGDHGHRRGEPAGGEEIRRRVETLLVL